MSPAMALIIAALIPVESPHSDAAHGQNGELGCLQIKHAVIVDVNRIQKAIHFVDSDRLNRDRSILICRIYLEHYGSADRLKRDADPRDYALIWHFGPKGYLRADEPEAKRYWAKVREAMAANGRRGTSRVTPETWMHHD